jgi:hypothetical protein
MTEGEQLHTSPATQIGFGKFVYDRPTKIIINCVTAEERQLADYTDLEDDGRRYFSDDKLALAMFKGELEESTFKILNKEPYWVTVQMGIPFLELIGKVYNPNVNAKDNENFRCGVRRLIPVSLIEPAINADQYEEIEDALWYGLRYGLSHLGFM